MLSRTTVRVSVAAPAFDSPPPPSARLISITLSLTTSVLPTPVRIAPPPLVTPISFVVPVSPLRIVTPESSSSPPSSTRNTSELPPASITVIPAPAPSIVTFPPSSSITNSPSEIW